MYDPPSPQKNSTIYGIPWESLMFMFLKFQADTDKDGRLSLAEMIENPYVFYSSIYSDDDDDDYHDELR